MTFTPIPLVMDTTPAVPPLPPEAIPLADLIQSYRDMRDTKDEIATRHKEEMEPVAKALAEMSDTILRRLGAQGQTSSKTSAGTATVVTSFSYTMGDPGEFRKWMETHPEGSKLLGNTVSKESLEEYLGVPGNSLPPGIKPSSVTSLRVNKPTAKKEK